MLVERPAPVRSEVLASRARASEPLLWQVALRCPEAKTAPGRLFSLQLALEEEFPLHVASLSTDVAAYKVHGAPEILPRYYPELKRREFLSGVTIGHSRYSTNTLPTVLRAQPFSLLGHNGEINTIARLREEARMLGIDLPYGGSDSQDLNRTLEGLICRYGFTLFEAMELVFPPVFSAVAAMDAGLCRHVRLVPPFPHRQRPGTGRHHRPPRRPLRLQRRCHGPPSPLGRGDRQGDLRLFGARGRPP